MVTATEKDEEPLADFVRFCLHQHLDRTFNECLREIMTAAYQRVLAFAHEEGVDLRTAALTLGVKRVADAQKLRGLYP